MRNFYRCMQLQRLFVLQQQQRVAIRCFPTLISRPYHHNSNGGSPSPSPSSNNMQTHFLPSLSPNNCYLFLHQPATESPKKEEEDEEEEEDDDDDEEEEVPTPDNCPDRLYNLAAGDSSGSKMLNIIKNHNRLHVDLSNSRCIGSSRGWLLFINRTTLALHLLNPFHANPPIIPLPAIESLPSVIKSETRNKSPLTATYSVGGAYSSHGCFNSSTEFLLSDHLNPISSKEMMILKDRKGVSVKKFAISSDPLGSSGSNCYRDCIVMILCTNDQLAFWRLNGKDKAWTALSSNPKDRHRNELMYSSKDKLFYAIVRNPGCKSESGIEVWDLHTDPSFPKMNFFKESENSDIVLSFKTLPEFFVVDPSLDSHSSKLLMVRLVYTCGDNVGFNVSKVVLDYERNEFTGLPLDHHLGDHALLLDHNQATFLTASQFPNLLKPNSIYFIHEEPHDEYKVYDDTFDPALGDAGLAFGLGDKSVAAPLFPSITNKIPVNGASWVIHRAAIL